MMIAFKRYEWNEACPPVSNCFSGDMTCDTKGWRNSTAQGLEQSFSTQTIQQTAKII